jgi:hypothetical protein
MVTTYNAAANAGEWIEINVTPTVVGNGTYTFALASNNNQRLRWQSRENDEPAQLVVLTASGSTSTPTLTPSPTPTITPTPPPPGTIVVDHNAVGLFEQIPEAYLQAAANLDMLFVDRSVGANINDGLDCLAYASDEEAPNHCTRFIHLDPAYSVDSSELNWYHAGGYDRSNWDFELWPMECDSWSDKLNCFFDMVEPQYEVVSFQYSYLEVDENSTIADMPGGFFSDNSDLYDLYDLEAYANQHPDKIIIYWTTSLARGIGTNVSESFNEQMRNYALQNNKILFDVADILAHDPQGNPCYDNRDGIPYNGENYPNDGQAIPAICPHYTTEVEGGHLGSVSAGKIRVAKAFWVLMARIAGWNGG